ncbi:MAG: TlpA family protein disulfide reductase [Bacteroidia bacterium]|nr:TlpA family protein disulfide reductase [Bacteroidia bacterium]
MIFIICGPVSFSQNVTVSGTDKEWSGKELLFYTYSDQITYIPDTLCRCKINTAGDFSCSFILHETKPVYVLLGKYIGVLYAEPDKTYQIQFPENKEKTKAELLNPYFEEEQIYLDIENATKNELNNLIRRFDRMYNDYTSSRFYEIYKFAKHSGVDSVITFMDTTVAFKENKYFDNYKKYKFAHLRYFAYIRHENVLTKEYYRNQPILYNNTAYMNLFNQAYDNYFKYYAKTPEGANLPINIAKSKSVREIKKTLSKNMALDNDDLKEFVILKGLHDAYFSHDYKESVLLQTLDSLCLQTANPEHKKIGENIRKKILQSVTGSFTPSFELYGTDSALYRLSDFRGKYVYLCFCNTLSYACREEFELQKKMFEKNDPTLEFITIFTDEDTKKIKDYVKKNGYKWLTLSSGSHPQITKEYNAKVSPSYYLIDPNGKLIVSPAKTMKEGFEEFYHKSFKEKP